MTRLPKYLDKTPPSKKGRRFEDEIVKRTINSGNLWFDVGDVKTKTHLIQGKKTEGKSFSISHAMLEEIFNQALSQNKIPIVTIKIKDFIFTGRVLRDDFYKED